MSPLLATRTSRMHSSAIREILKVTQQPDVISLAGGLPAPELFPLEAMKAAADRVFGSHGPAALQYSPTEGIGALRSVIASRLPYRVSPERVLVTTGSQQGISLLATVLLDPGDLVVVETPSYLGALQAFDAMQADYLTVASDENGVIPEALEAVLASAPRKPKLLYLVPNHQNPSGVMLAAERRPRIVEIAERHDLLILEDDPYGALTFHGEVPPSLHSYSETHVIYLGSFSKIFAPGLRVAYCVAPPEVQACMVQAKQSADLQSGSLDQYLAFETFAELDMPAHLARLRATYGSRCEAMLESLACHFPRGTTWTHPTGGMFVWVTLDMDVSTQALLERAIEHRVAFVPGAPFCVDGSGTHAMRLNFSNVPAPKIDEGIQRLSRLIRAAVPVS